MTPGIYNIPAMVRGDTFASRAIATATDEGSPLVITSARLQVRTTRDHCLIYEWSTTNGRASIVGTNSVVIDEVAASVTEDWVTGNHVYDLECVTDTYGTITLLSGTFLIMPDITKD